MGFPGGSVVKNPPANAGGEVEMQGLEGGPQGRGYMYACD